MIAKIISLSFKDFISVFVGFIVLFVYVIFTGLLPHLALLGSLSAVYPKVLLSLIFSTYISLEGWSLLFMSLTLVFLFINMTLLVFYIRKKKKMGITGIAPVGVSGVVASIFGIGCGSCGTVIGTSLIGVFGASGVLVALPLGGQEIAILGLLIFAISIRYLVKKISDPDVCQI